MLPYGNPDRAIHFHLFMLTLGACLGALQGRD
jgi:hypothetical protein